MFAVGVVLLMACANVAGLLLVRAIRRRREYAVRLALGARSSALLRHALYEGLLLSLAGGLLGLALAATAIRTALHLLPESMPRISAISMDAGVVLFALLLAIGTGVLSSLAPAFAAMRVNLTDTLKEGAQAAGGARSHGWLRGSLVVAEMAIAMVLLTAAGAFLQSLEKMHAVDPGFTPEHVLVAGYRLPLKQYDTHAAEGRFDQAVVERLSSKPGTSAAGITTSLPASGGWAGSGYTIEGVPVASWKLKFAMFAVIHGNYFRAMDTPLLEGRVFTADDRSDTPLVIVVNRSMARDCWPGQSALGKRMHAGNPHKAMPWATVVGVVADTALGARDEASADQWYIPANQPATLYGAGAPDALLQATGGYIVLRSALPADLMAATLRAAVAEVDPLLALEDVEPMQAVVSESKAPRQFNTGLITAFAAGALLLAITGIYAVVAFSVSLRTQEIAIRMALGAQRGDVARLVLASAARLALAGCGLGALGSLAVSRVVGSFLFGVSATDPLLYAAGAGVMIALALVAAALPARRAASADPIAALRSA